MRHNAAAPAKNKLDPLCGQTKFGKSKEHQNEKKICSIASHSGSGPVSDGLQLAKDARCPGAFCLIRLWRGAFHAHGRGPASGDRSLQAIIEDIQAQFETGGIYRPARVTESVLRDRYGLADDQVEDYYGYYSTADGYADNLLAVKARAGQIDAVKRALEMYREDLMAAMEKNGIGYAYDRARNMQVITRGNYAFLVAINSLEADSTTVPLFDSENKLVAETINKSFA